MNWHRTAQHPCRVEVAQPLVFPAAFSEGLIEFARVVSFVRRFVPASLPQKEERRVVSVTVSVSGRVFFLFPLCALCPTSSSCALFFVANEGC